MVQLLRQGTTANIRNPYCSSPTFETILPLNEVTSVSESSTAGFSSQIRSQFTSAGSPRVVQEFRVQSEYDQISVFHPKALGFRSTNICHSEAAKRDFRSRRFGLITEDVVTEERFEAGESKAVPRISPTNRDNCTAALPQIRAGLFGEDGATNSPTNPGQAGSGLLRPDPNLRGAPRPNEDLEADQGL
jgi:hypothetical protein